MTYAIRHKRPTKRCRRGKNNSVPAINFKNITSIASLPTQYCSVISNNDYKFLFLIGAICLLIILIFIIDTLNMSISGNQIDSFPFLLCSTEFTKRGIEKASELFRNKNNEKISKRDVERFNQKYKNNKRILRNKRRELKLLKANNKELKTSNKELKKEVRDLKKKYIKYLIIKRIKLLISLMKIKIKTLIPIFIVIFLVILILLQRS